MPTYLSPGVYVEEVPPGSRPIEGVGTAVAAFVGFTERGPLGKPVLVTNWTQFTDTFGGFLADGYLAQSVYGFFVNGGGSAYVVRIGEDGAKARGNSKAKETPAARQATIGGYRFVEVGSGGAKGDLTVEIQPATPPAEGEPAPPDDAFTLLVKRGAKTEETYPNVTARSGKSNVVTATQSSKLIRVEEAADGPITAPGPASVTLGEPPPAAPARITADDYVGDVADRTGVAGLQAVDEVTMVIVPDLMSAYQRGVIDEVGVKAVQTAMIDHCTLMGDRMAVLDPPPGLYPQEVKEWRTDFANYDSKFAALYYPWIEVVDPSTGRPQAIPPSGHMAGVWARNDDTRGVHKAPANEVVRGAIGIPIQLTKGEHDLLNPVGINCIRTFPGRGIRVWGARTLSSDAEWRYLNVRRLFNYLEESILDGTQWVVFEPNDDALWARIRRTISAFLVTEWRKGALFGLTPDEAFYVKCDRETNSAQSIELGQVVCEVGVAPVKPAEFVIFKLAQMQSGASLVNE